MGEIAYKKPRDLYRTSLNPHLGLELDHSVFHPGFARQALPKSFPANSVAALMAALRVPPVSSLGVAVPGTSVLCTGRIGCNRRFGKCGLATTLRTAVSAT